MLLSRIHLNPRSKDARRDLADAYQLHATLCRAFYPPGQPCPQGAILWRLEPETDAASHPRVLVQSRVAPDWSRVPSAWLAGTADPPKNLVDGLALRNLAPGARFRFRLRANACKTVGGRRIGLRRREEQRGWLERKAAQHGFELPQPLSTDYFDFRGRLEALSYRDFRVTHEAMLTGSRHDGAVISVYAAMFEGVLSVRDPQAFRDALGTGIGHGKVMGLGLLSVAPIGPA